MVRWLLLGSAAVLPHESTACCQIAPTSITAVHWMRLCCAGGDLSADETMIITGALDMTCAPNPLWKKPELFVRVLFFDVDL